MSLIRKMHEGLTEAGSHRMRRGMSALVQTVDGSTVSGTIMGYCESALVLGGETSDDRPVTIWVPEEAIASVALVGKKRRRPSSFDDAGDLPISFNPERHKRDGTG